VTGNIEAVQDRVKPKVVPAAPVKPATIRDVALRAGVSHQTVSRVINASPNVADSTRSRVFAAIQELGYVPSPIARGLTSNRTHSLGLVTDDISDFFFGHMVAGAEAEARRRGYYLMIGSIERRDDERGYLRLMFERRVEGLILARPSVPLRGEPLIAARRAGVPLVLVCAGTSSVPGVVIVDVDNRQGGYDATRHLLVRGHRRIATIIGPEEWPSSVARLQGYRQALEEFGVPVDPTLEERADDWGVEGGEAAAARFLARPKKFTALFAQSDLIALGAIARLRQAGLRVPEDVSVVGYDDLPVAAVVDPPLTTIHQPMQEVGELATTLLLDQLQPGDGRSPRADTHLLPAALVDRGSVIPR
jgi:DNA-binding LacI/PurR family transcriptional regulator